MHRRGREQGPGLWYQQQHPGGGHQCEQRSRPVNTRLCSAAGRHPLEPPSSPAWRTGLRQHHLQQAGTANLNIPFLAPRTSGLGGFTQSLSLILLNT